MTIRYTSGHDTKHGTAVLLAIDQLNARRGNIGFARGVRPRAIIPELHTQQLSRWSTATPRAVAARLLDLERTDCIMRSSRGYDITDKGRDILQAKSWVGEVVFKVSG